NQSDPLWRRLNRRLGRCARIRTAASFKPADRANGHVVVTHDLTRQTHSCESLRFQSRLLRQRHARRLAADELDAARRAARVAAAGVQHINLGILLDREYQSFAGLDIHSGKPFNGQLRHARYVNLGFRGRCSRPTNGRSVVAAGVSPSKASCGYDSRGIYAPLKWPTYP